MELPTGTEHASRDKLLDVSFRDTRILTDPGIPRALTAETHSPGCSSGSIGPELVCRP
jgi:hypothetical protein